MDSWIGKKIRVRVPATTANCGPGFDVVGLALTLYNELELEVLPQGQGLQIQVKGITGGKEPFPLDESNLVVQAMDVLFQSQGRIRPDIRILLTNRIPPDRGLGSSAAAIVGGLIAANALLPEPLLKERILELATRMEGHPDNVAPAIYGHFCVSALWEEQVICMPFALPEGLKMVAAVPEFTLSTHLAREALPKQVAFEDAIFNMSRCALLIAGLLSGSMAALPAAFQDKLHQPYRQKLIPGFAQVLEAARQQGALGAVLSGAGSTCLAFVQDREIFVGEAMVTAFKQAGLPSVYHVLEEDVEGAVFF